MINIHYIEYSLATNSLDIFVAGCHKPLCKECCNPELADFGNGQEWHSWKHTIEEYILNFDKLIKNIFLLGGSFNHQKEQDLPEILDFLSKFKKDIWLFQREPLDKTQPVFKKYCSYIKCGEFVPELRCGNNNQYGINLATSNQIIFKKGKDY